MEVKLTVAVRQIDTNVGYGFWELKIDVNDEESKIALDDRGA